MDSLNLGTKEIVSVYLNDKLGNIDVIGTADYKIMSEDETITMVDWAVVENIDAMRIDVLIDTTIGNWEEGVYKLYVRPSIPPEAPIIGPWEFGVS